MLGAVTGAVSGVANYVSSTVWGASPDPSASSETQTQTTTTTTTTATTSTAPAAATAASAKPQSEQKQQPKKGKGGKQQPKNTATFHTQTASVEEETREEKKTTSTGNVKVTCKLLQTFAEKSAARMSEWVPLFEVVASQHTADKQKAVQAVQVKLNEKYGEVWEELGVEKAAGQKALDNAVDVMDAEDNDDIADDCQTALDILSAKMKDAVGGAVMGKEGLEQAKAQLKAAQDQAKGASSDLETKLKKMPLAERQKFIRGISQNATALMQQVKKQPAAQQTAYLTGLSQEKKDTLMNYQLLIRLGHIKP